MTSRGGGLRLGVVGATGVVGRVICDVLGMRGHSWGSIRLAASDADAGTQIEIGDQQLVVERLTDEWLSTIDIALVDIPPEIAAEWVPRAAGQGVVVIDNSPTFRLDPEVPLVVPEINPASIRRRPKSIIACPGATVLTMIDTLAALNAHFELTEIVVTNLQASSGQGRTGIDRLRDELSVVAADRSLGTRPGDIRSRIANELPDSAVFPDPLALNVIPFVGESTANGWTSEEDKVRDEVRKILGRPQLVVSSTCVRVPVIASHSVSLHAKFGQSVDRDRVLRVLLEAPGVVVLDDPDHGEYPTPADAVGSDPRFVGRLHQPDGDDRAFDLFICGDNLRKGSGLNMVQTAELVAQSWD